MVPVRQFTAVRSDQLFGQAVTTSSWARAAPIFWSARWETWSLARGDDQVRPGGDDRIDLNLGEGTDLNEGGAGTDTVEVNGGMDPSNSRRRQPRTLRPRHWAHSLDIGTSENLVLNMNGGDDTFTGRNGLAVDQAHCRWRGATTTSQAATASTRSRGDGNDVLTGGRGNDVLVGGSGDDKSV